MIRSLRRQHFRWALFLVIAAPAAGAVTAISWHGGPPLPSALYSNLPNPVGAPSVTDTIRAGQLILTVAEDNQGVLIGVEAEGSPMIPDPLFYWTPGVLPLEPDSATVFLGSPTSGPVRVSRRPRNGTVGMWDNAHRRWAPWHPWPATEPRIRE